jgi:hypothetical protein
MPAAGGLVAAGAQLLQIRTQNQLLIAVQRPRDSKAFESQLLAEAAAAGEDFFYSIPFKDHVESCNNRRSCNCPKTYVEGPGVGLARSAGRLWGNCAVDTYPDQETDDAWTIRSTFVDFETNYTRSETKMVSKWKPVKGGRWVRASDKELDKLYQIGASKVERDTIVRALPKHIMDRAWMMAQSAAKQSEQPIKEQVARLLRKFNEHNVSLAMIEKHLGFKFDEKSMKEAEQSPSEVCARLRGLLTAINSGDVEVDEYFGADTTPVTKGTPVDVAAEVKGATPSDEKAESPRPTPAPKSEGKEQNAKNAFAD